MKKLLSLIFCLCLCFSLNAFSLNMPYVDTYAGGNFYHATSSNFPYYRTSFYVGMDINLLDVQISRFDFGFGATISEVQRSFVYGRSVLKGYISLGGYVFTNFNVSELFILGLKTRLCISSIQPRKMDQFASIDIELIPRFRFYSEHRLTYDLIVPFTYTYRKDGHNLRLSFGISMGFFGK